MRRLLTLTLAAAASCAEGRITSGLDAEKQCFVGDPALPPEMELIYRSVDGEMVPLEDGGEMPLILPPQGGKVFLVGVRARNIDTCGVRLAAAIIDPCSGRVVGRDGRPVFLVPGPDGWAIPRQPRELSDYANVPACPNFASDRDVNGEPYQLQLQLIDGQERTLDITRTIVPVCAEAAVAGQCDCECDKDYILGLACEPDPVPGPTPGQCPTTDVEDT